MTDQAATSFGIHSIPHEDGQYEVSRTGVILYPKDNHLKHPLPPIVMSFVNGSMAINPLHGDVNCVNFDHYIMDVLSGGKYRFARFDARRNKGEPAIAYFDPAKGYYGTVDPEGVEPANEGDNY